MESLITLGLLAILCSLFPLLLKAGLTHPKSSELESKIFLTQVAHEAKEAQIIQAGERRLTLIKGNGDRIQIEQNSGQVRRLRNGAGYVPMLFEVSSFQCDVKQGLTTCRVELRDGTKRERTMISMAQIVQGHEDEG